MVRHGRLRRFSHLECKSEDDCVSAYRNVEVVGEKCGLEGKAGRLGDSISKSSLHNLRDCVNDDMEVQPEWAIFGEMWRLHLRANV